MGVLPRTIRASKREGHVNDGCSDYYELLRYRKQPRN